MAEEGNASVICLRLCRIVRARYGRLEQIASLASDPAVDDSWRVRLQNEECTVVSLQETRGRKRICTLLYRYEEELPYEIQLTEEDENVRTTFLNLPIPEAAAATRSK